MFGVDLELVKLVNHPQFPYRLGLYCLSRLDLVRVEWSWQIVRCRWAYLWSYWLIAHRGLRWLGGRWSCLPFGGVDWGQACCLAHWCRSFEATQYLRSAATAEAGASATAEAWTSSTAVEVRLKEQGASRSWAVTGTADAADLPNYWNHHHRDYYCNYRDHLGYYFHLDCCFGIHPGYCYSATAGWSCHRLDRPTAADWTTAVSSIGCITIGRECCCCLDEILGLDRVSGSFSFVMNYFVLQIYCMISYFVFKYWNS